MQKLKKQTVPRPHRGSRYLGQAQLRDARQMKRCSAFFSMHSDPTNALSSRLTFTAAPAVIPNSKDCVSAWSFRLTTARPAPKRADTSYFITSPLPSMQCG